MRQRVVLLLMLLAGACRDREQLTPERLHPAFFLGETLANIHAAIDQGGDSEGVRRLTALYWKAGMQNATALGVEIPARTFTTKFDPRVEEEMRRIAATNGSATALCFAFSYHTRYAEQIALRLSTRTPANDPFGFYRMDDLNLLVHTNLAVQASRELGVNDISETGTDLPQRVRAATALELSTNRTREMQNLRTRFANWHMSLLLR